MRRTNALPSLLLAFGVSLGACSSSSDDLGSGAPPSDGSGPGESGDGSAGNAGDLGDAGTVADDDGGSARALGVISNVAPGSGMHPCPTRATCQTMTVSCSGIPDLQAVVALLEPAGVAKGTIFVHGGGGGEDFYQTNVSQLVNAGFRVASVRWDTDWELTPGQGIKAAACRPVTVMKWIFDQIHKGDRATGFCAYGHSGGSGVIGYALAHYGAETFLDYAALLAGPPFARLDYGCAPSTYSGPAPALCPELPNAPLGLPGKIDPWEGTTTCAGGSPSASDLARWAADSIVSPGADYEYPNTPVDFWDCATKSNGTAGGAYFYSHEIRSTHAVHCATDCNGEALGPTLTDEQLKAMIASCKRHP